MKKNKITFTVIELNKPSKEAIEDLNKLAYKLISKAENNENKISA